MTEGSLEIAADLVAVRHPLTGTVHLAPSEKQRWTLCGVEERTGPTARSAGWEWETAEEDEQQVICRRCIRVIER